MFTGVRIVKPRWKKRAVKFMSGSFHSECSSLKRIDCHLSQSSAAIGFGSTFDGLRYGAPAIARAWPLSVAKSKGCGLPSGLTSAAYAAAERTLAAAGLPAAARAENGRGSCGVRGVRYWVL